MIYALYGLGALIVVCGVLFLIGWSVERRERLPEHSASTGSTANEPGCGYYDTTGGDSGAISLRGLRWSSGNRWRTQEDSNL